MPSRTIYHPSSRNHLCDGEPFPDGSHTSATRPPGMCDRTGPRSRPCDTSSAVPSPRGSGLPTSVGGGGSDTISQEAIAVFWVPTELVQRGVGMQAVEPLDLLGICGVLRLFPPIPIGGELCTESRCHSHHQKMGQWPRPFLQVAGVDAQVLQVAVRYQPHAGQLNQDEPTDEFAHAHSFGLAEDGLYGRFLGLQIYMYCSHNRGLCDECATSMVITV